MLVPIEARRFLVTPFPEEEKRGLSGWIVGRVRAIVAEGVPSFDNSDLVRALLSEGTLAVAIDGVNEVDHGASRNSQRN